MAIVFFVVVVAVLAADLVMVLACLLVGSKSDAKMRDMSIPHHQDGQQFKEE